MAAQPQTRLVTVEEFEKMTPASSGHYELHHGEVILVPPPTWDHQNIQDRLQMILKRLLGQKGYVRMEMAFRPFPEYEVWAADVGYVQKERGAAVTGWLAGSPELVVEVLSPSNTTVALNDRMATCLRTGCLSFWVVDPKQRTVSVTEGDVTRHYGVSSAARCCLFDESVSVAEIFE